MIPLGYMAKHVASRPDWLPSRHIVDIYSVSNCISKTFADYIRFWKHNGYWMFDSPAILRELAREHAIDLTPTTLFYYEAHELEFDDEKDQWNPFASEPSIPTDVLVPSNRKLEGYDIVSYSVRTSPECSPLSCNSLAETIETNEHCLLPSLERALELLKTGAFENAEPGPYRILAVHTVPWTRAHGPQC